MSSQKWRVVAILGFFAVMTVGGLAFLVSALLGDVLQAGSYLLLTAMAWLWIREIRDVSDEP